MVFVEITWGEVILVYYGFDSSIKKKVLALWDGLRGGVHHMHMNGIWAEGIPPPSL